MSAPYKGRMELVAKELEGTVLDAGCCAGPMHRILKELRPDCRLYGIDTNVCEEYRNDKDIVKGDVQDMHMFPSGKFDTVVAGELIEHLSEPDKFLAEACRILKPNGKLILTTNNRGALINRVFHTYETERTTHVHIFTKQELLAALERNGFSLEKLRMLPYVSSRLSITDPLRVALNRILPDSLRENFFIVARKAGP